MDRNFVGLFRALPYWPNNLVPMDEVVSRLISFLSFNQLDTSTVQSVEPTALLGGLIGVNDMRLYRYDGVTTVTGNIAVAAELVFSPFQSYVGLVLGKPAEGITTFRFELRLRDEPPIQNEDEVFLIDDNPTDPQLSAFTPVEKNPDTGFLDIGSWKLKISKVSAKIRLLKGVTRVEQIDPGDPGRGFRPIPKAHVDAGVSLSFSFDADGNFQLWPPELTIDDVEADFNLTEDIDFGLFHIDGSPWVFSASGMAWHHPGDPFPAEIDVPLGLQQDWSGFMARQIGGFLARVPTKLEDEAQVYGIEVENLFIGDDVFAARASFVHGGGPNDPFVSTTPVPNANLPSSRWSVRRISAWVAAGAGDFVQFGGQVKVAAILDWFNNQPVVFDLSCGRVARMIEGHPDLLPFVELTGALSSQQNSIQPTPDGRLRLPLARSNTDIIDGELRGVEFGLFIPSADDPPGLDLHVGGGLNLDLTLTIGEEPVLTVAANGVGFIIPPEGAIEVAFEGGSIETNLVKPLNLWGYKFSISRISFGFSSGDKGTNWLGFDAHLEFPDSLGRADVYGMQFYWNDEESKFKISGVGIAVKKPTIEFEGVVRFLDGNMEFTPEGEEPITIQPGSMAGNVRLAFPAASVPLAFQVGIMHGNYVLDANPDDERSFWMLSAELVFPAGIPLGLADMSFYGLSIAFGDNVAPRRSDNTLWFDWYAKQPPVYDVIAPSKWTAVHGRSAYGLGLILGSQFRSGYPHNERALLLLNTASETKGATWIFDGKARFLKEVTGSGKPTIAIFAVFSPDEILIRAELHFAFPDSENSASGFVLTARAMVEVLHDKTGAGRHHVYLGKNQPLSQRINASILSGFFSARSFYMLDWTPLQLSTATLPPVAMGFGFSQGWNWDKKWGPLRVYLEAGVELEAGFSFAPAVYGYLRVYGGLGLKIWGFGFGLALDASLTFFCAEGWELFGSLRVKLNLPWPIPDYKKTLDFSWGPGVNPPDPLLAPARQMALSSPSQASDLAVHEWTEMNQLTVPEGFAPGADKLAVDGSIVLALRVPVSNEVPWISGVDTQPVDGSGEWKFRYALTGLDIERKLPGAQNFEPLPADRLFGFLEIDGMMSTESSAPVNGEGPLSQSIRIWGDTPGQQLRNLGSLERAGSVTWLEGFLERYGTWPCGPDADLSLRCVHYELPSFRILDPNYSRITVMPDGTAISSRTLLNPDEFENVPHFFVTLDEVVASPLPADWTSHDKALRLPYAYAPPKPAREEDDLKSQLATIPRFSGLEVDLPFSSEVVVTLLGVLPAEQFTVQAFHGQMLVRASSPVSGVGVHVITLSSPQRARAIDRIRILSVNQGSVSNTGDPTEVSAVGSICFQAIEQLEMEEHIVGQRQQLDHLVEVLSPPPGIPGDNADHFNLHANGTQYRVTPRVRCERKGNTGGWQAIHQDLALATAVVTAGAPPDDLRPYLDETLPMTDQDPFYLDNDVRLRFNRSFGPEMYTVSGEDFTVDILDTDGQPVPVAMEWQFSEESALTPDQEMLIEQLNSSPCITADLSMIRKKLELVLRPELEPRTHYRLVVRSSAHPDTDLYEAPFTTSFYSTFVEHFQEVGEKKEHELLPRAIDGTVFSELIAAGTMADRHEENTALERAWEEGMGLAFRERPRHGECTLLFALNGSAPGSTRAIVIDSPEPLFVEGRTELVVTPLQNLGANLVILRSFDGARSLVFAHDGQSMVDMLPGNYMVEATYRREAEGLPTESVGGDSSSMTESFVVNVPVLARIEIEVL